MVADWIKNLKPGDRVAVAMGSWSVSWVIAAVIRRTGSGRVVAKVGGSEVTFNPNGHQRGADWGGWCLHKLTAELEAEIQEKAERSRLLPRIESTRWRDLPIETLRAVVALLPQKEKE